MHHAARKLFPCFVLLLGVAALSWAVSFGTLPRADFAFQNGDEVKTVDPAKAVGQPEHRVITAMFEGLYREWPVGLELDEQGHFVKQPQPDENGNYAMTAAPGMAESCDISEDGRTYTFHMRRGVEWSDGSPFTAHDFVWSWRRTLHPETASQYAYQLWYLVGAKQYTLGEVKLGDAVEIELPNRPDVNQPFPRGDMRHGRLVGISQPPKPPEFPKASDEEQATAEAEWKGRWVYLVESPDSSAIAAYSKVDFPNGWKPRPDDVQWLDGPPRGALPAEVTRCQQILLDFDSSVGVRATDDHTLVVELNNRTPFFLHLTAFYPLFPVNRRCVETHGTPDWTKSEHVVCNGAYVMQFRRVRDRLRLVKNPRYWAADTVRLEVVDALAVKNTTTAMNMYLSGQADWITDVPVSIVPELMTRPERDFAPAPVLIVYFYRLNVTKPPLDDVHVRRALNLALDKQLICDKVTQAGQRPARSFVPPGLPGYESPLCGEFNVEAARAELAQSKYAKQPGGIPKIEILYNTHEGHRAIAEVIQQQWKNNLGIDVELKNTEWQSYLTAVHAREYSVARAGWVPDYPDANTFIDMWVTGGENNETGWSNPRYDELVQKAAAEPDPDQRLRHMEQAEAILMEELPVLPIYYYVSKNMVSPRVQGFFPNIQDQHPIQLMRHAE